MIVRDESNSMALCLSKPCGTAFGRRFLFPHDTERVGVGGWGGVGEAFISALLRARNTRTRVKRHCEANDKTNRE